MATDLRSALHDLISEMDGKPWHRRYLHVGTIAAVLTETDGGASAPGEFPSLSPEAVAPAAPSSPTPVFAGQREQIVSTLHAEKRVDGCLINNPSNCERWHDAQREAGALLSRGGLVDLSSDETLNTAARAVYGGLWDELNDDDREVATDTARMVLAALTSGEQTHG